MRCKWVQEHMMLVLNAEEELNAFIDMLSSRIEQTRSQIAGARAKDTREYLADELDVLVHMKNALDKELKGGH